MTSLDAERRLLDMLAGWSDFKDTEALNNKECATTPDLEYIRLCEDEASTLALLYQEVGELLSDDNGVLLEEQVRAFFNDKIIPFIMKGK
jgi:hypothetical protein